MGGHQPSGLPSEVQATGTGNGIEPLGLAQFSFGQVLSLLTQEAKLRITAIEDKTAEAEDKVNSGVIPRGGKGFECWEVQKPVQFLGSCGCQ